MKLDDSMLSWFVGAAVLAALLIAASPAHAGGLGGDAALWLQWYEPDDARHLAVEAWTAGATDILHAVAQSQGCKPVFVTSKALSSATAALVRQTGRPPGPMVIVAYANLSACPDAINRWLGGDGWLQ